MVMAAVVGSSVVGGAIQADASRSAANTAADAQANASKAAISEQQKRFQQVQQLLSPYTLTGVGSLSAQRGLVGLDGVAAQQSAIANLQNGPQMAAFQQQGENAILQNASATGGLRGGNTQAALAQFRPQLLNSLIENQYNKLGGLTSIGQNSAAMTGNAGMSTGNNISQLMEGIGAARAGQAMAQGQATQNAISGITQGIGAAARYF